jgi:hypothetical protein
MREKEVEGGREGGGDGRERELEESEEGGSARKSDTGRAIGRGVVRGREMEI